MSIVGRKLDLAARNLDLLSAVGHVTSSSSPLIRIPWEIGQWLGREKLTQHELEDCMRRANGLIVANENGQILFENIVQEIESKPVGPLFLHQSGSLGRLMASDPNMSWMISTVACLFQYHRDERFVAQMLTNFIIRSDISRNPDENDRIGTKFLARTPEHTQVEAVVSRIVSSVWYNVVNAGCDVIPLPDELMSVCSRGHYLDSVSEDFSLIVHTLVFQCKSKAVLRTNHLLRDLMLWLFLHYDGLLVVTLSGKVIYERDFGNPDRELEVSVKVCCADEGSCGDAGGEPYEILQNIAGKLEHFLSGQSLSYSELPSQPGIRQPLYEIPKRPHGESALYDSGLQVLIKCTAQTLMSWLLQVSLHPQRDFSELGFSVEPIGSASNPGSTLKVSDILQRLPAMVNMNWGLMAIPSVVYVEKNLGFREHPSNSNLKEMMTETKNFHESREIKSILPYFPLLEDFIKKVGPYCRCGCASYTSENYQLKPGCLRQVALEEVMLLLAHGIADGFGGGDASSVLDTRPILDGAVKMLVELCTLKRITWDLWFGLAASVCLGCPFRESPDMDSLAYGGTAYAAIQFGNVAAIAPWLDLDKRLAVRGCFGLIMARGRVGIHATSKYRAETEFQSVAGNFAIIETEGTEDTVAFNRRNKKDLLPSGSSLTLEKDITGVMNDTILTSMDDTFYRLLTRIKTLTHWRVVDPSDAMSSIIRRFPFQNCPHAPRESEIAPHSFKTYSSEELLGRWPDTIQDESEEQEKEVVFHISPVLDTPFKQNIALALSVCTTALEVDPSSCCLSCAMKIAKEKKRAPLREHEGGKGTNRFLIDVDLSSILGLRRSGFERRMIRQADTDDQDP